MVLQETALQVRNRKGCPGSNLLDCFHSNLQGFILHGLCKSISVFMLCTSHLLICWILPVCITKKEKEKLLISLLQIISHFPCLPSGPLLVFCFLKNTVLLLQICLWLERFLICYFLWNSSKPLWYLFWNLLTGEYTILYLSLPSAWWFEIVLKFFYFFLICSPFFKLPSILSAFLIAYWVTIFTELCIATWVALQNWGS